MVTTASGVPNPLTPTTLQGTFLPCCQSVVDTRPIGAIFVSMVPTNPTTPFGPTLLLRGTPGEVATHLVASLGTCLFDRGALHRYIGGCWRRVDTATLAEATCSYSGSPKVNGRPLMMSAAFANSVKRAAQFMVYKVGFFDAAPAGINFANGFVAVVGDETRLQPHSQDDRACHQYEFDYVERAQPTKLLAALNRNFRHDADRQQKIDCIQEFFGACLAGVATQYKYVLVLQGLGPDGKSALGHILSQCMPRGAVDSHSPHNAGTRCYVALLEGCLLSVTHMDTEPYSAKYKALVEGAMVTHPRHPFRPRAGHLIGCNQLQKNTQGVKRIVIQFRDPLLQSEINPFFVKDCLTERQAIINWGVEGLKRLLKAGRYTIPPSSPPMLSAVISAFLSSCCTVLQDGMPYTQWTKASPLHGAYTKWALERGIMPANIAVFGAAMKTKLPSHILNSGVVYQTTLRPIGALK